jgi:hypothetical protein
MRFFMICGITSMLSRSKYFKGVGKETISILVIYKYEPSSTWIWLVSSYSSP